MAFNIKDNKPRAAEKAVKALSKLEQEAIKREDSELIELPLSSLVMHPDNEEIYTLDGVEELAEDIKEVGLVTPLIVRQLENGQYQILSGHRRYLACREIDLEPVKAVVIKEVDDLQARRFLIATNNYRVKSPMEQAREIQALEEIYSQQNKRFPDRFSVIGAIAADLDTSTATVRRISRLSKLIPELQELVDREELAPTTAERFAGMDSDMQLAVYQVIRERQGRGEGVSLEEASRMQQEYKETRTALEGQAREFERLQRQLAKLEKKENSQLANSTHSQSSDAKKIATLTKQLDRQAKELAALRRAREHQVTAVAAVSEEQNAELILQSIRGSVAKIKDDTASLATVELSAEQRKEVITMLRSVLKMF